jgi:hypothetical protein
MLSKTHPWAAVIAGILYLELLFGLTTFAGTGEVSRPNCVLCGLITDAKTGQGVTDAIVQTQGGPSSETQTDANGFYYFEKIHQEGNCRIAIDSNEYVGIYDYAAMPIVNLSKDKQAVKDFKLDRACMIRVQVVDEANQPVEGAELSASALGDERSREIGGQMRRKRTDKDGNVLLGGFPPSKAGYMIIATHGTHTTSLRADGVRIGQRQSDYAPGKLTVMLNDTNIVESGLIVLQKGVDVNGIAKYKDGVPASDLSIYAYPDWWSSNYSPDRYSIDANGNFVLRHIVAGIYQIYADIPKGKGGSVGIPVSQISLPLSNNEPLKVTIPQKSPQSLASISGRLIFTGDKIPNYAHIEVYSPEGGHHFADIGRGFGRDAWDTNFVIDRLEPGKYRITFSSSDVEQKVLENVEAPREGLEVELAPAEKTNLKGTVINSQTSQPIQRFKARARKMRILRGANRSQPDKWLEFDDADGKFNIEATGPGIYQVQIAAEDFAWAWSEEVNTDQNVPVVIKLSAGGGIKGRVVNGAGQPVNGAKVVPLSKAGGVRIQAAYIQDPFVSQDGAVETVNGMFELKNLAPGKESIKAVHPDYAYSVVSDIEVKEGQTTEDVKVVMPAGGIAQGYVYDAQGQPQSNVTLYFQDIYSSSDDKAGRLATVTTDANGYYRAGGLPEQLLTVKRQKEWESMGVVCRTLVPANGKVSHLDFGGQPNVRGHITINGVPLANRKIVLSGIDQPISEIFRCYAMTGPDGGFAFGGIPNGKWAVYYEDAERRGEWIKITKVDVTGEDVNLGVVSARLSTIRISVEYEQGVSKWDISRAYLQEGNKPWGLPIAQLNKTTDENEPYIVKNIPPGEYTLVLMRQDDYVTFRRPIEVTENDANIIVRIPKCTAGIAGLMTGKFAMGQTFWREDKAIVAYSRPDANAHYKLDNLPAGRYLFGGNMLIDSGALLEFELADGEQKILDVNVPDIPKNQISSLQAIVLDENGVPIPGVDVRLQGDKGVIEPVGDSSMGIYFITEPGTYTLQASFPGYKPVEQQVSVKSFNEQDKLSGRKPIIVRLERK